MTGYAKVTTIFLLMIQKMNFLLKPITFSISDNKILDLISRTLEKYGMILMFLELLIYQNYSEKQLNNLIKC